MTHLSLCVQSRMLSVGYYNGAVFVFEFSLQTKEQTLKVVPIIVDIAAPQDKKADKVNSRRIRK